MASHDLEQPLRKIVAFGDRLSHCSEGLNEQCRDYLERMQNAARRMSQLTESPLRLSRVSTRAGAVIWTRLASGETQTAYTGLTY